MSLLFLAVIILCIGVGIYALRAIPGIDATLKGIVIVIAYCVAAILCIFFLYHTIQSGHVMLR